MFWLFSSNVCYSYFTVTFRIFKCPQLVLSLAADKWLLFHPWAYVAYLNQFHFQFSLDKAWCIEDTIQMVIYHQQSLLITPWSSWNPVTHDEMEAAGLSRGNRKARSCLLSEISTTKSYFSSWWAKQGEKHTLDFNYKHHIWISKLSEKHQNHNNLFANNWHLRAKDS